MTTGAGDSFCAGVVSGLTYAVTLLNPWRSARDRLRCYLLRECLPEISAGSWGSGMIGENLETKMQ